MKIDEAFHGVKLVGLDTALFIYFIERNRTYIECVREVFRRIDSGRPPAVVSALTLTEVLPVPIARKQISFVSNYRNMLSRTRNILSVPVTDKIAESAARLSASYQLRATEALHIATAIDAGCDAFISNDPNLGHIRELRMLTLSEFLVE